VIFLKISSLIIKGFRWLLSIQVTRHVW